MRRGDAYWVNLNPVYGAEQGGERLVLIIQNDIGNARSGTVIVAPMTTQTKRGMPTHVSAGGQMDPGTIILLEQIRTLDKCRLGDFCCHISDEVMGEVDVAIKISLGLNDEDKKGEGGGQDMVDEERISNLENRVKRLEESASIGFEQQKVLDAETSKRVVELLGDKNSETYREFGKKIFAELNRDFKEYFQVSSRNSITLSQFNDAMNYIRCWAPCNNMKLLINKHLCESIGKKHEKQGSKDH